MARKYRKDFTIIGSANSTQWDDGITSSEAETKKVIGVVLFVTGQIGNIIKGNLEREEILSIYDYHIDTDESTGSTNVQKSTGKKDYFDLDIELDVGKTFKMGHQSGATAKNVFGYYLYELAS